MDLEGLPELIERSFEAVAEIEMWENEKPVGGGTGFVAVLDEEGENATSDLVFTNAHVANAGSVMRVSFRDGKELAGELLGTHPMVDIALFRLKEARDDPLFMRGQGEFRLGEFVIALGHPMLFSWTATAGLISGVDRPVPNDHHGSRLPITMLQTSAEINKGNSGGPLIGLDGKVAGINTSGFTVHETMLKVDFAIPAHSARLAAKAILGAEADDHVPRPWTGLPVSRVPWKAPQDVLASFGVKGGAKVSRDPDEGSPASEAGLRDGDIVIGVGEQAIDDPGDVFTWMLDPSCLNQDFELRFIRDGEVQTATLRVIDQEL